MSEYRWDSGGKGWTPALPTDAMLVTHLLATYLDSQLPQSLPESRPFSSHYLVRQPEKPQPGQLCMVETSVAPPNYILQTRTDTFHLPKVLSASRYTQLHIPWYDYWRDHTKFF